MPLGNPYQGERIASIVDELVRKQAEREAQERGFDLGEFLSGADENVARNEQELQRQEAQREHLRQLGMIASNRRDIPNLPVQIHESQLDGERDAI